MSRTSISPRPSTLARIADLLLHQVRGVPTLTQTREPVRAAIADRILPRGLDAQARQVIALVTERVALRARRAKVRAVQLVPTLRDRLTAYRTAEAQILAAERTLVVIPLGEHTILPLVRRENARLQEWSLGTTAAIIGDRDYQFRERGSNSCWTKKSTFQRGILQHSAGRVDRAGNLTAEIATNAGLATLTLRPWRGWAWTKDANGILLRHTDGRDYHPTAAELLATTSTADIAALARAAAAKRRAVAKRARHETQMIRHAEREGLVVCLADSLRAGNCEAGSRNWAQAHGFDVRQHARPSDLLAVANGDTHRVALVVAVAARRHAQEMARGYSLLSEHGRTLPVYTPPLAETIAAARAEVKAETTRVIFDAEGGYHVE